MATTWSSRSGPGATLREKAPAGSSAGAMRRPAPPVELLPAISSRITSDAEDVTSSTEAASFDSRTRRFFPSRALEKHGRQPVALRPGVHGHGQPSRPDRPRPPLTRDGAGRSTPAPGCEAVTG